MEHNQTKTNLLDATDKSKRLTSLLSVMSQALNHAKTEVVGDLEECLIIAWELSNSISGSLSSTSKTTLSFLITQYPTLPVELPTSLRGETAAQQTAASTLTIGERIRVMRKLLGLTQGQVADAVGVTTQAVSLWESNSAVFGCDKLLPLASALNCDPLWLLGANADQVATNEASLAPVEVMQGVDMAGVGERIRDARVSRRMTHKELEEAAGLPDGEISVWESRKAYPPDEAFDKLAKALNTSVIWLLTGREIARES
ncbi:helix-turn-helix domain-containing protein [Enterobacter ludwigii]|uniref:helix-turn-helix domain-containing protein n=1 Tax=Enterobacter ludwigii TaxID=299767 RepID=UPI003BEF4794